MVKKFDPGHLGNREVGALHKREAFYTRPFSRKCTRRCGVFLDTNSSTRASSPIFVKSPPVENVHTNPAICSTWTMKMRCGSHLNPHPC